MKRYRLVKRNNWYKVQRKVFLLGWVDYVNRYGQHILEDSQHKAWDILRYDIARKNQGKPKWKPVDNQEVSECDL